MKKDIHIHILISFILLGIALVFVGGAWFVHHNQRAMEAEVHTMLTEELEYMRTLAEITDQNGADDITEIIISDCPRRSEYEELLNSLATLTKRDLIAVQTLRESCGSFYSERKALMVSKLEREFTQYTKLLTLLATLTERDIELYHEKEWEEIVSLEKSRSTALRDQERLQSEIITALISGESVQSVQVTTLARDAQDINELLVVYNQRIDEIRARVAP